MDLIYSSVYYAALQNGVDSAKHTSWQMLGKYRVYFHYGELEG